MLVAGSVQLLGRDVRLDEVPAPRLNRDYECSNAKLSRRSASRRAARWSRRSRTCSPPIDVGDRSTLTDPRYYNIRWLELMDEVGPHIERFGGVL